MEPTRANIDSLNGWRGVLAIAVCFAHAWQNLMAPATGAAVLSLASPPLLIGLSAKLAVFSFFALSGYVISMSVTANARRNDGFDWLDYALARLFRIAPPLLFALALGAALATALHVLGMANAPDPNLSRSSFTLASASPLICLATLCGTGTLSADINGPLWTLDLEIQLYVIAGLLVLIVGDAKARPWAIALLLAYLILGFRPYRDGQLTAQPVAWLAFASGWAVHRYSGQLKTKPTLIACIGALVAAGFTFASGDLETMHAGMQSHPLALLALAFYSVATALFLRLIAPCKLPPTIVRSGEYSYTLYIIHFPLLLFISFIAYRFPQTATSAIALGLVSAVAVIWTASVLARHLEDSKGQRQAVESWLLRWQRGAKQATKKKAG